MTTPKEALERALEYLDGDSPMHSRGGHRNEVLRAEIKSTLASLQGEDVVERVALAWAKARNEWMRASRHGTQEEADKAAVAAILATGLVPDEAAIRADEREKCAKVAETPDCWKSFAGDFEGNCIAAAIRAGRGEG